MKIGFFSTMAGQPWGGSEELWTRSAHVLLGRGHEVAFNTLAWQSIPAPLQILIDRGAIACFRKRWRLGRSLNQTLRKLRLTRQKHRSWLLKQRPDFVLISFACHTDDPQIARTCHAVGVPYAILLQAAGWHSWIDPRSLDEFRAAYAQASRCYFVSSENREVVESNLAMDLPHAEIVDNPFNVGIEAAPSWPSSSPYWKLACVARVNYSTKGQDLIARIMRMPKWRQRPLQVSIWGSDNGNLQQLRQTIENYGIGARVVCKGISHDIEQLWAEHHGLLLPSRAEGNALSLIEAMICGRVPITTNVGRASELIDDNESGFISPAATVELIDDALERAWQSRTDWQTMGQRAARAIRARHSLQPAEDFADRILEAASQSTARIAVSAA
jgi:glycosyltransferase involved in cell wall biosynthesis